MKKKLAVIAFAGASLAMFAGAPSAGAAQARHAPGPARAPGSPGAAGDHARRVVRVRHPVQQLRRAG